MRTSPVTVPFFRPVLAAFQGRQLKPTVILLVSSVTLITWKCFASPQYLEQLARRCGGFSDPQAAGAIGRLVRRRFSPPPLASPGGRAVYFRPGAGREAASARRAQGWG